MMQSCASAAKLRSGGPILPLGMKAMSHLGTPPPRTVIGHPSQADGLARNCRVPSTSVHCAGRRPVAAVAAWRSFQRSDLPQFGLKLFGVRRRAYVSM